MKVPMKVLIFLVALCRRLLCSSRQRWRTLGTGAHQLVDKQLVRGLHKCIYVCLCVCVRERVLPKDTKNAALLHVMRGQTELEMKGD